MSQMEFDSSAQEQSCREAIERLLARRNWGLLESQEFVRRTVEHLRAGACADPIRAATYTYCHVLYAACSGVESLRRKNIGYSALFCYLYDASRRRYPDICDDATQQALEITFRLFGRCREPGAFLSFAFQQLVEA